MSMPMPPQLHPTLLAHPDAIAECVLQAFRALPAKCKPRVNIGGSGGREWGILAGIVLERKSSKGRDIDTTNATMKHDGIALINEDLQYAAVRGEETTTPTSNLLCAALATGMKCLPQSKIVQAQGNVLHDWHAEVLAIRAFNRWLADECLSLAKLKSAKSEIGDGSAWVQWNEHARVLNKCGDRDHGNTGPTTWERPFTLRRDVAIHMYISEAPCGDASMELTMADQEDDTPWSDRSVSATADNADDMLLGRGHFSRLGIVRRKPARPDAPPTLSKSCSDKLALKQCTSLLSGVTSLLLDPRDMYLRTLVLPQNRLVEKSVSRAFGPEGRMKAVQSHKAEIASNEYGMNFFDVLGTTARFEFEKAADAVPSNIASLSTIGSDMDSRGKDDRIEVLINGVLQGRKQSDPRGASRVSRRKLVEAVAQVLQVDGMCEHTAAMLSAGLEAGSYASLKQSSALQSRRSVKDVTRNTALLGWVRNGGDEDWEL